MNDDNNASTSIPDRVRTAGAEFSAIRACIEDVAALARLAERAVARLDIDDASAMTAEGKRDAAERIWLDLLQRVRELSLV
jgi:hypothetical protein